MNELFFLDSPQCPKPLIRNQYNFWGARKAKVLLSGLGLAKKEKKQKEGVDDAAKSTWSEWTKKTLMVSSLSTV